MLSQAVKAIVPKSLSALVLFLILSASAATAQTSAERIVFHAPFQFTAGGELLLPGAYTIWRVSQTSRVYFIKGRDGRSMATVSASSPLRAGEGAGGPQLIFNAYGGQYFLSQVRPGGDAVGAVFKRSRAEREVAQNATESRLVTVAAAWE